LEGVDLGDARRNERAKTLLMRFAEKPTAGIPCAQGRRRAWCQHDLGGLAARYHTRRNATCASGWGRMNRDVYNEAATGRYHVHFELQYL